MDKDQLKYLWELYREFCETQGHTRNYSGKIESAVAFLQWIKNHKEI